MILREHVSSNFLFNGRRTRARKKWSAMGREEGEGTNGERRCHPKNRKKQFLNMRAIYVVVYEREGVGPVSLCTELFVPVSNQNGSSPKNMNKEGGGRQDSFLRVAANTVDKRINRYLYYERWREVPLKSELI